MSKVLSKQHRLKKKNDFERVFKQGKGARKGFLSLKASKNELPCFRAGFVVSKKISNKAVVRNKVKRRLRYAVRGFQDKIRPGWDLVFIAHPGIENQDFQRIKDVIQGLLEKLELLNKQ